MSNYWQAYRAQRNNAKARDILFQISYIEWLELWADSGHLHERGLKGDGYVMSRFNDNGPYHKDNIEIIKTSENTRQPQVVKRRLKRIKEIKDAGMWSVSGDYGHLRDRGNHPKARVVIDPDGVEYPSASMAAEIFSKTRAAIAHRCRTGWGGWHYKESN